MALSTLNKEPSFKEVQKHYQEKITSYAIFLQNLNSITAQQERVLITLHHILNSLDQQKECLRIIVLSMMKDNPIDKNALDCHIQDHINRNLPTEKLALFEKLQLPPEQAPPSHTDETTSMIEQHPILIFAKYCEDWTPLHVTANENHTAVVEKRLEAGSDVKALSKLNRTPLLLASERGWTEVSKPLLEAGANPNSINTYDTPLNRQKIRPFILYSYKAG